MIARPPYTGNHCSGWIGRHCMKRTQTTTGRLGIVLKKLLQTIENGLDLVRKPALVAACMLIVIWCVSRVMEALLGNAVFDTALTYWFGLSVWALLLAWFAGSTSVQAVGFKEISNKKAVSLSWALFGGLVALALSSLEGYRIASSGLLSALSGSQDTAAQQLFILFKYHSFNPMLAMNLAAFKLLGHSWGLESLAPYIWSWNVLFAFFVWSCAYGIILMISRYNPWPKVIHLSLAIMGLAALLILKSTHQISNEFLIVLQAATSVFFIIQILLFYSSVRHAVSGDAEMHESSQTSKTDSAATRNVPEMRTIGFPPSAIQLAVVVFLVLPILSDLHGRFELALSSARIEKEVSVNQEDENSSLVSVAPISIRSGPATGDDVLGVLPKGTKVRAKERKLNWVNIGKNRWVPEKYLRPHKMSKVASSDSSISG